MFQTQNNSSVVWLYSCLLAGGQGFESTKQILMFLERLCFTLFHLSFQCLTSALLTSALSFLLSGYTRFVTWLLYTLVNFLGALNRQYEKTHPLSSFWDIPFHVIYERQDEMGKSSLSRTIVPFHITHGTKMEREGQPYSFKSCTQETRWNGPYLFICFYRRLAQEGRLSLSIL